jgi:hypothetical protein
MYFFDTKDLSGSAITTTAPGGGAKHRSSQGRQVRLDAIYLRAAQAYMLISMPTGTSTIFGVFQAIGVSSLYCGANLAQRQPKSRSAFAQA